MAKLVMTIDSDSEVETKVKGKKQTMQQIVNPENEEILLSNDVLLQNIEKERKKIISSQQEIKNVILSKNLKINFSFEKDFSNQIHQNLQNGDS